MAGYISKSYWPQWDDNLYTVVTELGEGGCATVYLAKDLVHHRYIAIKTPRRPNDHEHCRRLHRESEVMQHIRHQNIALVFGLKNSSNDLPCLLMEFVNGPTLADFSADHDCDVQELSRHLRNIGRGIEYAHKKGVIHRDLKPKNMMISADRIAKLLDFNICWHHDATPLTSMKGIGTRGYASPDQLKGGGQGTVLDDIFSFGAVIYECFAKRPAFDASSDFKDRSAWDLPPLKLIPQEFHDVVQSCLEYAPGNRPASMSQILGAWPRLPGFGIEDPSEPVLLSSRSASIPRALDNVDPKWLEEITRTPQNYAGTTWRVQAHVLFGGYVTPLEEKKFDFIGVKSNESFRFRLDLNLRGLHVDCFASPIVARDIFMGPQLSRKAGIEFQVRCASKGDPFAFVITRAYDALEHP